MKKILCVSVVTFAAVSMLSAQERNVEPRMTPNVFVATPAIPPAVVVNNTINNNCIPSVVSVPTQRQSIQYRRPQRTYVTNITNNYYGDTTTIKTPKDTSVVLPAPPTPTGETTGAGTLNDWLYKLIVLALVLALLMTLAWWLLRNYRKNNPYPITPSSVQHTHTYPQQKTEQKVEDSKPASDTIKKDAMEKAATTGGSFTENADKSWKVEFTKPEVKKEELAQ